MSDLTDFLLARIAEDEAVARAVPPLTDWENPEYGSRFSMPDTDRSDEDTLFVTRFDPNRVLAECEAKRQWLDWVQHESTSHITDERRHTLRFMALPYTDHPDYREEWQA